MSDKQKYISYSKSRDLRSLFWGGDQLLKPSEVCQRLNITKIMLRTRIKQGKIKFIELDKTVRRFWLSDILTLDNTTVSEYK